MIIGKNGIESGSKVFGAGGNLSGSSVFGDGGDMSGSMVFNNDILTATNIPTLSGSQYGQVVEPYVFAGDFEIEREVAIPDETLSTFQVLIGSSSSDDNIAAKSDGTVQTNIAGTLLNTIPVTINPYDGKVHIWKIKRVGNTGTLLIDGIVQITGTVLTGNSTWDMLWANTGIPTNFFQGQDLSYQFTDNGTPLPRVVLDSGSIYYQLPRGESLGAELVTNITVDSGSDYTDGIVTLVQDGVNDYARIGGSVASGRSYELNYEIISEDLTGNNLYYSDSASANYIAIPRTVGVHTEIITPAFTGELQFIIRIDSTGKQVVMRINSIKQFPDNALILKNFALTDWSLYTLQRNIAHDGGTVTLAWVGDNVVANGRFAADTDWTKGVGWTIASGKASSDGSQAGASDLAQASLVDENSRYLQKITASNISAGGVKQLSGGGLGANITADGSHIEIITASSGAASGAQADINFVGSVDNISIQHLLEVI